MPVKFSDPGTVQVTPAKNDISELEDRLRSTEGSLQAMHRKNKRLEEQLAKSSKDDDESTRLADFRKDPRYKDGLHAIRKLLQYKMMDDHPDIRTGLQFLLEVVS